MKRMRAETVLAVPGAAVLLLLAADLVVYLLCLRQGDSPMIPVGVLVADGALIPGAVAPDGYWRLFAAGFLHADPSHLLANCASLVVVGPFLERRLGCSTFALIYGASLVGASVTSVLLHHEPFVGVGASGAIFGVMGALFALWALGAEELSPGFFLFNFGLNFAFAARDPRIDWAAHIGGFATGMTAIASLDMLTRVNRFWLRCKFPEFVKTNLLLLAMVGAAAVWLHPVPMPPGLDPRVSMAVGATAAALVFVKGLDLLLAARRGLAWVALVLAACNAAALQGLSESLLPTLAGACRAASDFGALTGAVAPLLCREFGFVPWLAAFAALLVTLLLDAAPLVRGLRDVGFVAATFMGDRRRETALVRATRHTRV